MDSFVYPQNVKNSENHKESSASMDRKEKTVPQNAGQIDRASSKRKASTSRNKHQNSSILQGTVSSQKAPFQLRFVIRDPMPSMRSLWFWLEQMLETNMESNALL